MREASSRHASWQDLLALPAPAAHIVQLYDSHAFLASAVGHFAAEGLRHGDAVLLTGTQSHLRGIRRALASLGVDAEAAVRRGQLTLSDAQESIEAVVVDGVLDEARFRTLAGEAVARARGDSRYSGMRWWGEMTNVLCQHGDDKAGLRAEELGGALAREHGVRLFCSFLFDPCDPLGYGRACSVCGKHSHVIPANDYVRHRVEVNRAISEEIGEIKGPLLQSLLSWQGLSCELPTSQSLLFWLREVMPERFAGVLSRMKGYQS